jgi:hypothetical protein
MYEAVEPSARNERSCLSLNACSMPCAADRLTTAHTRFLLMANDASSTINSLMTKSTFDGLRSSDLIRLHDLLGRDRDDLTFVGTFDTLFTPILASERAEELRISEWPWRNERRYNVFA